MPTKRKPSAAPSISLGTLQTEAEAAARRLKAAQRALLKAQSEHDAASLASERSRVALNQGVTALKASIAVSDIYAS